MKRNSKGSELLRGLGSTSPPGGNQNDGLPPASSIKTVAKRESRRPRMQMHSTMINIFLNVSASGSVLVNDRLNLSYTLRLLIKIVKPQNDRAISEFYLLQVFFTGVIF